MEEKLVRIRAVPSANESTDAPVVALAEFVRENGFEDEERAEVEALEVGDEIVFGGGAAQEFHVERVA
ncbi:MAG: hypothetical protein ACRD3Q_18850 [Terriglobales bacterium]